MKEKKIKEVFVLSAFQHSISHTGKDTKRKKERGIGKSFAEKVVRFCYL